MKKSALSILAAAVFFLAGHALPSNEGPQKDRKKNCVGHVTLSSQRAVDAFRCEEVNGLLTISGDDITNLNALSSLAQVRGLHITGNPLLTNLDGLSHLEAIRTNGNTDYAALLISGNTALEDIDGLSSLREINGKGYIFTIAISENPRLNNLNGLFSLSKVGPGAEGGIRIHNNVSLENVDGLSGIMKIHPPVKFALEVTDNESLNRCCGLFPILSSLDTRYYSKVNISGNGGGCTLSDILDAGPCLSFQADKTNGCANDTITFTAAAALTTGIHWDFGEGANPMTAEGAGPHAVIYENAGMKTVELSSESISALTIKKYVTIIGGPGDRNVFPEVAAGCAGHATNILVQDYEPGIMYTLRTDADNGIVAGPYSGDIGLYTGTVWETTTFNVLASDPETGCESVMSVKPVVTIDSPLDKEVAAETPSGQPGHATNIIVLDAQPGIYYLLRNDEDDSPVSGPYPGNIGLYTGALSGTTTFNILAYDSLTECERELSGKITITITDEEVAWEKVLDIYPNPATGVIDLKLLNRYAGSLTLQVRNIAGEIVFRKEMAVDSDTVVLERLDLESIPEGVYIFSLRYTGPGSGWKTTNSRLLITD